MTAGGFGPAFDAIWDIEGGWVDDPDDPGGATKHGISLRFAGSIGLDLDGDGRTTGADIKLIDRPTAYALYHDHFWAKVRGDELPAGLDLAVFDGAVLQGWPKAARLLQRAARVRDDGIIGPVTLAKVQASDFREVLDDFLARRAKKLAEHRNYLKYARGWHTRLFQIHALAVAMRDG